MPDFSKAPGGFGSGASAANVSCFLVVIEEYATGEVISKNRDAAIKLFPAVARVPIQHRSQ